jgi:hypothetical protein
MTLILALIACPWLLYKAMFTLSHETFEKRKIELVL